MYCMNRAHFFFLPLFVFLSVDCWSQVDNILVFDLSSSNATNSTEMWKAYSDSLISESTNSNFIHYLHNGRSPIISAYDSPSDIIEEMDLLVPRRPDAVDELKNILFTLDKYELNYSIDLQIIAGKEVFYSNDRLLYQRLKFIMEQSGVKVNMTYHFPESDRESVTSYVQDPELLTYQIKYFQ